MPGHAVPKASVHYQLNVAHDGSHGSSCRQPLPQPANNNSRPLQPAAMYYPGLQQTVGTDGAPGPPEGGPGVPERSVASLAEALYRGGGSGHSSYYQTSGEVPR